MGAYIVISYLQPCVQLPSQGIKSSCVSLSTCRSDQISYLSALSISFSAFQPVWPATLLFIYRLSSNFLMFIRLGLLRLVRNLSLDRLNDGAC